MKQLGKSLWFLIGASLLVPLVAWLLGDINDLYALITLWFVGLGILVMLAEFVRDVRAQKNCSGAYEERRFGAACAQKSALRRLVGAPGHHLDEHRHRWAGGLAAGNQVTLDVGDSVALSGYQFTFNDLENYNRQDGVNVSEANLSVSKGGQAVSELNPQRHIYFDMGLAITQPSAKSNLALDIYAILVEFTSGTQNQATFRLYVTPLVNWLWIGVGS